MTAQLSETLKPYIEILNSRVWWPQPGKQLDALVSPADELLYGGAAGGGKTDLAIGLALTEHKKSIIFRREATQLTAIIDRMTEILQTRDGYNGAEKIWRLPHGRQVEFGSCPHPGDEAKFQGRPHDLIVFDEAAHFLESQVLFLMGWVRSTDPKQRKRVLFCSNPPTSAEGEWLIRRFRPWLDDTYGKPAQPGELRWFAMLDGVDTEVPGKEPFKHESELIIPTSRTFIPSKVADNPFLKNRAYERQLQALPEPLRSQMLEGDFKSGRDDNEWQVIATDDIRKAQKRWKQSDGQTTSVGVDPSRGGRDKSIIAIRRGWVYDPLIELDYDNGQDVAGHVLKLVKDSSCPVHVDVIGIGASVFDHLEAWLGSRVIPINGAARATGKDMTGTFEFRNLRAQLWWRMKELLSEETPTKVSLPRDTRLLADLATPQYKFSAAGIIIEGKREIIKRLGRSPDRGDAVVYAAIRTPVITSGKRKRPFKIIRSLKDQFKGIGG